MRRLATGAVLAAALFLLASCTESDTEGLDGETVAPNAIPAPEDGSSCAVWQRAGDEQRLALRLWVWRSTFASVTEFSREVPGLAPADGQALERFLDAKCSNARTAPSTSVFLAVREGLVNGDLKLQHLPHDTP